jgi:CheY-like chemotaxis protein
MPLMNGKQLAQELRKKELEGELRSISIVLVSGEVLPQRENAFTHEGVACNLFDECLLKPFSLQQLQETINTLLLAN